MKANTYINEEELIEKAVKILLENLGPVETKRFLSLSTKKRMESVRRHRVWQSKLDKGSFLEEVFKS